MKIAQLVAWTRPLGGDACWARVLLAGLVVSMSLGVSVVRAQPPSSATSAPDIAAQEQFICRLSGMSDRRIGIYRPPGGPQRCRVDYTRDGRTRSLWSAGHDYEFCVRKALQIVGLLERVKFHCSPQTSDEAPSAGPAPIR